MTLWTLLQAILLLFNAAAILNEKRVLEHYGWGFSQLGQNPVGEGPGALKHQIIGTLHAATYMRVPLVVVNVLVIFLKLIIG
eukprot:jgi/Picsp_1/2835/NSC_01061-R1_yos1-like protein